MYYDKIFSKIKNIEDAIALFILSEVNKEQSSIFYFYFLNMLDKKSPLIYDYDDIELLDKEPIYDSITKDISKLKSSYNDLRRLLFSYSVDFREEFIGSFLFGDYLWAL